MEKSQTLSQTQRLTTRLSQQQLRFVRLLELTAPEFEEAVSQEMESNPALEAAEGTSGDNSAINKEEPWRGWRNHAAGSSADIPPEIPAPDEGPDLYEYLYRQLAEKNLQQRIEEGARFIIGSLDTNGYLRVPLQQLMLDLALAGGADLSDREASEALEAVRGLDPPGVGATSLRDCLILQAERLPSSEVRTDALAILNDHFEEFSLKHYDRMASAMKVSRERVAKAVAAILQLNPKPGSQFESRAVEASNYVVPDFILEEGEHGQRIIVNNRIPELVIDRSFSEAMRALRENARQNRKGNEFVSNRFNDARDFIRLVEQRQNTLSLVAAAILSLQKDYFDSRDVYRLRPMMIKDITAMTGLDASTISRATAGKYIQTPWGIFPMRFFFSDTVGENGSDTEALTNRKLEAEIKKLVAQEDKRHPLSDDKIQKAMRQNGYDISRRTVAKYRDRLRIPVARLRKEL